MSPGRRSRDGLRLLLGVGGTGLFAGVVGIVLTLVLHAVQHLWFGYTENTFLVGVERASALRRVLGVGAGGLLGGAGWWLLRRGSRRRHANVSVTHALRDADRMPVRATLADALVQILVVGAGASLGREGAPRQVAASLGADLADRLGLRTEDRRLLLAAGAGAGLAAVYNVPLSGAVFALEVLLSTRRVRSILVALAVSVIATVTSWSVLGWAPTYGVRFDGVHPIDLAVAASVGVVAGLVGAGMRSVTTWGRVHAPPAAGAVPMMTLTFLALGAVAIPAPELLGNGKNLTQLAFEGSLSVTAAAVLTVLKPLATAACLRSGAIGGILTPSLTTGATLGVASAGAFAHLVPSVSVTVASLAGAAAVLAVVQRAPLTAVVFTLELTRAPLAFVVPVVLATAVAVVVGRRSSGADGPATAPSPGRADRATGGDGAAAAYVDPQPFAHRFALARWVLPEQSRAGV